MSKQRSKPLSLISIFFLLIICLGLSALVFGFEYLPRLVDQKFGSASKNLSTTEKVIYSIRLLTSQEYLINPTNLSGNLVQFEIQDGESANSIAYRLEKEGLIPQAEAFRSYLIYSGADTNLKSGTFELNPNNTPIEIALQIQDVNLRMVQFTILAGWRVEEIANSLGTSGLNVSADEFLTAVRNPSQDWLPAGFPALSDLEGYLLPGTYEFSREVSTVELIRTFLYAFDAGVTSEMRTAFESRDLSFEEAVILASIVEKEAVLEKEQPLIASVFYNRLAIGMKLDSDPTVQYSIGFDSSQQTWWKNPLTISDLGYSSSYNTYQNIGLPPGPICNPGISALQSVAYPAETPYYYFRAKCDGSGEHSFATTFEEHLNNACQ